MAAKLSAPDHLDNLQRPGAPPTLCHCYFTNPSREQQAAYEEADAAFKAGHKLWAAKNAERKMEAKKARRPKDDGARATKHRKESSELTARHQIPPPLSVNVTPELPDQELAILRQLNLSIESDRVVLPVTRHQLDLAFAVTDFKLQGTAACQRRVARCHV